MRKTIEEVVEAIEELYASGKYDAEARKTLISNTLQAHNETLLAELEEGVVAHAKSLRWGKDSYANNLALDENTLIHKLQTVDDMEESVLSLISSKRMK